MTTSFLYFLTVLKFSAQYNKLRDGLIQNIFLVTILFFKDNGFGADNKIGTTSRC